MDAEVRKIFDRLESNGKWQCPDCGLSNTMPYGNCGCPPRDGGYGTKHINLYHHSCEEAMKHMRCNGPIGWRSQRFTRLYQKEEKSMKTQQEIKEQIAKLSTEYQTLLTQADVAPESDKESFEIDAEICAAQVRILDWVLTKDDDFFNPEKCGFTPCGHDDTGNPIS